MKVKKIISFICLSILLSIMTLPVKAERKAFYPIIGKITQINKSKMTVSDHIIRISPTVKLKNSGGDDVPLSGIKIGDFVGLNVITINGRQLVDIITMLPKRN